MATVDLTNVLFKIAHPDLYARNPFNLLNLPIDATAKDIRRRREDIDAAFEAGTEEEEFKYVLPLDNQRKPPTLDAVHEAFDALNDPEMRIAYSLFWFWPSGGAGRCTNEELESQIANESVKLLREAEAIIARIELGQYGECSALHRHNLAVMHHMQALFLEGKIPKTPFIPHTRNRYTYSTNVYWNAAIHYWNSIVTDADFWHTVSELVDSLNDPRLDYRFARSLHDQFAFAFDQINVELAIMFAKADREPDAKRQVEYMKLSQPEADDVEGTFDNTFAGLQRLVEAIVNVARDEANSNPKSGLAKVDEILERTKDPVQISRIIFGKGEPIRESVIATIFAGVRSCMIAYGNATTDWDGCLKRIDALKSLAENDRQKALVAEDERIIKENKKVKDEEETCSVCKCRYSSINPCQLHLVPLWGRMKMGTQFGQVSYSQHTEEVRICKSCGNVWKPANHPEIKKLLEVGWVIGEKPTKDDIARFIPNTFHEWCLVYEDKLLQLSTMTEDTKKKICFELLDILGIPQTNWILLNSFLAEVAEIPHGRRHYHTRDRGCIWGEASPGRELYGVNLLVEVLFAVNKWILPTRINKILYERLGKVYPPGRYNLSSSNPNSPRLGVFKIYVIAFIGKRISLLKHAYCKIQMEINLENFVDFYEKDYRKIAVGFRNQVNWAHISIEEPNDDQGHPRNTEVSDTLKYYLRSLQNLFCLEKKQEEIWNAEGVINTIVKKLEDFTMSLDREVALRQFYFSEKDFAHYVRQGYMGRGKWQFTQLGMRHLHWGESIQLF